MPALGSFATVWSVASHFQSSPNIGRNQITSACLKRTPYSSHGTHPALEAAVADEAPSMLRERGRSPLKMKGEVN
jgi:hypothetical protein